MRLKFANAVSSERMYIVHQMKCYLLQWNISLTMFSGSFDQHMYQFWGFIAYEAPPFARQLSLISTVNAVHSNDKWCGRGGIFTPAFQKCWLRRYSVMWMEIKGWWPLLAWLPGRPPLPRLWCWWCQIMVNRLHFSLEERTDGPTIWWAEIFL